MRENLVRPRALNSPSSIPGVGLLIGFLLGALLIGQLYLREVHRVDELTEQLAVAEEASAMLKEAQVRNEALIALLRAQAELAAAQSSLQASNFGLAGEQVLQAAAFMDRATAAALDTESLARLATETRQVQIRVSESPIEQQGRLSQLRASLAALTPR